MWCRHLDGSSASLAIGVMSVLFAAAQFFAAPILGVFSDRFGRGR
jgi:DHA1 family tetracycline resistance protein-like MFS transporter